jgi:signal transduction histidine kinase
MSFPAEDLQRIRQEAEKLVSAAGFGTPKPEADAQLLRLLHELQVHRVELELQNEALLEARSEIELGLQRYTDLYDLAPVGYFTLTRDGLIEQSNLAGAALFALPRASCAGRPFLSLLAPAAQGAFKVFLERAFASAAPLAGDFEFQRPDHLRLHGQVLALAEASGHCCRLTVTDISERVQAQAEIARRLAETSALKVGLEAAQLPEPEVQRVAAVGLLAAGAAHAINNPLAFVRANLGTLGGYLTELLAACEARAASALPASEPLSERQREVDFIRGDAAKLVAESIAGLDRLRDIVAALAAFARPDQQCWQSTDLQSGLASTLLIAADEIGRRAEIIPDFADLPPVWCAPAQIKQVFLSLLLNAAQSIETHGVISVRSGRCDHRVWFEVEDNGCGIAEQDRERLFDPFFTTRAAGQGVGLGLALARTVILRHRGTIDVRSRLGVGTVVRVTLPIEPALTLLPNVEAAN